MTRNIHFYLTALCMLLAVGIENAAAVPAYPRTLTYTQSDGTRITIRVVGDEYHHYVLSQEGYTLVGGPGNDYYYARLASNGSLEATPVKAKPISHLTPAERAVVATLVKGVKPTAASPLQRPVPAQAPNRIPLSSVGGLTPPARIVESQTTGDLPALIILVQFSDVKFTVSSPQEAFNALLNEDGYNRNGSTGSAWNYYHDNSNGKFNPQFRVVGPYTVSKKASYYAGNGGTDFVAELVVEACELADADVDFSQYADHGVIRDLFFFYAGHNQAEGAPNTIWPHRSDIRYSYNRFFDGAQVAGYACSSEYRDASGNSMANIGTFCHEFGHVLGWPDFYDTDYAGSGGDSPGPENYSLMSEGSYNNNSRTPPALNILERWMVGWCSPEEINESKTFELGSICDDQGLLIRTNTDNDYFLAEHRGTGKTIWDNASFIGNVSGMMVYHVDYTPRYQQNWTLQSNTVNVNPRHECMKLVRSEPGIASVPGKTFFPGTERVSSLTPTSNSDYISWSRTTPRLFFNSIKLNNGALQLTVERIGGPELNFKSQVFQYDALLSWEDTSAQSWHLSWKEELGSKDLGEATVPTPQMHLTGLQPATTYEVTISAKSAGGEEWSQTHTFTTAARGINQPHIGISANGYTSDEPILLTLLDYKGSLKEIQWYVDDKKSDSNYFRFTPGEHSVTAVIITSDDIKEYLIKYITVK